MDPNATLTELRDAHAAYVESLDDEDGPLDIDALQRLAQAADALDGWLSRGGYLPEPWAARYCADHDLWGCWVAHS